MEFDFVIVGGGLVGLGVARAILRAEPSARVLLLEKESRVATHQSGRNSGVIHAGVYYEPGSLRARLCTRGRVLIEEFAEERGIAWRRCGKLIVATDEAELPRLDALQQRALENGLEGACLLSPEEFAAHEPHVRGLRALWVPQTGVIDYGEVGRSLAVELRDSGLELRVGAALLSAAPRADGLDIATSEGDFRARALISCAGLHSDRVAARLGVQTDIRILPFLGQYHALSEEHAARVRGLVYPVPDPSLPFLGIHLTRRIGGVVDAGPNARLAMGREAYETGDFSLRDLIDVASFSGSYALLWRHRRAALSELRRASSRHKLVEEISRLLPGVGTADLTACPAGIRAQAVRRDGSLIHDFVIEEGERSIHVLNAPSPAATASLAIGEELCARALALLN